MTRKNGFTLIELLVVVSIIALLVSILMPALGRAREQAQQVRCLTNLNSMGLAFHTYAVEHDGWIPPRHATAGADSSNAKRLWQYELAPYLGLRQGPPETTSGSITDFDITTWANPPGGWANARGAIEVFMCPTRRPKDQSVHHFYGLNWWGLTGYGHYGNSKKLERVGAPSEKILVSEYTHWNFWHPQCTDYMYDQYQVNPASFNQGRPIGPVHHNGYNFLFADGSAQAMRNSQPRNWIDFVQWW